jgi:XTP/dITP diphosphohydrolase
MTDPRGAAAVIVVLATRNPNKVKELSELLGDLDVRLLSSSDFPDLPEIVEDGSTLDENAIKKAEAVSAATGLPALADDTGLEVAALGGAPGVLSARYAGPSATYDDNNRKLLSELEGVPPGKRRAVFRCVVALAVPGRGVSVVEGRTEGTIIEGPRGGGGFGYDPVFLPDGGDRTYAELAPAEKNVQSHRGKAVVKVRVLIAALAQAPRPDDSDRPPTDRS